MDFGLMLAAMTAEPTFFAWLGWKVLAWVGVAAGLTFVIFVHELGHFLVAKACGVKCEKFYVGFDFFEFHIPFTNWKIPRALVKCQWGETEYGIGSLPLGGYVKMLGQDDDPRNAEHEAERIRAAGPTGAPPNEALASSHSPEEKGVHQPPVEAKTTEGQTVLLDPRSYPAKPVPARMAIISAGVIMNLIFGVILAAVAYRLGVEQMPAIVGSTSPGAAAWLAGIEPGSKIIQIGKSGEPYEYLRWSDIRTTALLNNGQEVSLLIRKPNGQEDWYEVQPRKQGDSKIPLVGIGPPRKNEIEIYPERLSQLNPKASQPILDHDKVIEAAGQKITSGADLTAIFAQQPLGPLAVKIERREHDKAGRLVEKSTKPAEILEIVVEPRPMRELGLTVKAGPITALRPDSPGQRAGLQVGDTIVEINGQAVGDPLSLSQRLTPKTGSDEPVSLTVERRDKQNKVTRRTVSVERELPLQSPIAGASTPTSIESMGVALEVTLEVAEVAEGGPAAKAGLLPGDVLFAAQFADDDPHRSENLEKVMGPLVFHEIEFGPTKKSWADFMHPLQLVYPETKVKLTWNRSGKLMSETLAARNSETFFDDSRGLSLYVDTQEHVAKNWRQAASLGFREAREQLTQVLTILHRLVTLRLSATNLSGPLGIIGVAGSIASQGLSSLLLFLTMLSANLAVLNFLPIPALDGGHMLFLTAEAIRGKPVDERLQVKLTIAGVICLLSLMVFATVMDLQRFSEMLQRFFG